MSEPFETQRRELSRALVALVDDKDLFVALAAAAALAAHLLGKEQAAAFERKPINLSDDEAMVADSTRRLETFAAEVARNWPYTGFRYRPVIPLVLDLTETKYRDPVDDPPRGKS